jgi:hypothetical protein
MEARLGEQSEVVQKAFVNRIPSPARESIFGVFRCGCPAHPIAFQRRSSHKMKSTLGRSAARAADPAIALQRRKKKRRRVGFMVVGANVPTEYSYA